MTLYLVHGNTYYYGYGHYENVFGIYTEKDAAEAAKDLIVEELYAKNVNDKQTIVENQKILMLIFWRSRLINS